MNRAERRKRQKKQHHDPSQLLQHAFMLHSQGNTLEAEKICKDLLIKFPDNPDVLHLMGILQQGKKEYCLAVDYLLRALISLPHDVNVNFNLGNTYYYLNEFEKSIQYLKKVIELNPTFENIYNNLGNVYAKIQMLDEAKEMFEKEIELRPNSYAAYNNLGALYRKLSDSEKAIEYFNKALEIKPDYVDLYNNLGATWIWKNDTEKALNYLRKSADYKHNHGKEVIGEDVFRHRIRHDYEQICYLDDKGLLDNSWKDYKKVLENVYGRTKHSTDKYIKISTEERKLLAPSYNSFVYLNEGKAVQGSAISSDLNVGEIEAKYNESKETASEHIYVDNFLTKEALKNLRDFCLESTIWKTDYHNGYLGSFLSGGFASPIVLQVAEDLRTSFPGIFKDHKLFQAWGFKYDSAMTGINIHADFAAVNVNFWITPDEANLDQESGGLVVWDKASPTDWNFKDYNENEPKIREFLAESGAKEIKVPHRQNRAMIFNSTLFHKTDDFSFKEGYENRRINITFLYGQGLRS